MASFDHEQVLDAATLVDRFLSISFIATLDAPDRWRVEDELRAVVGRHGEPVVLRYRTDCYRCSAR